MSTITRNTHLGASAYRSVAFAAILVLAMFIIFDTALAAEPTLKDVIGGAPEEKAPEAKPKGEPKVETKEKSKPPKSGPVDELGRGVPRTTNNILQRGLCRQCCIENYEHGQRPCITMAYSKFLRRQRI